MKLLEVVKLGGCKIWYDTTGSGNLIRHDDAGIMKSKKIINNDIDLDFENLKKIFVLKKEILESFITKNKTDHNFVKLSYDNSYSERCEIYENGIIHQLGIMKKKYNAKIAMYEFGNCEVEKVLDLYESMTLKTIKKEYREKIINEVQKFNSRGVK